MSIFTSPRSEAFTVLLWQVERITQSFTERLRFLSAERLRLTDELRRAHAASPRSPGKVAHAAADSEAMVASLHAEIGELKARLLRKDGGAPADGERGALQQRLLESESRYGTLAAQLSTCEDRLAEQRAQREWLELETLSARFNATSGAWAVYDWSVPLSEQVATHFC